MYPGLKVSRSHGFRGQCVRVSGCQGVRESGSQGVRMSGGQVSRKNKNIGVIAECPHDLFS